MLNNPQNLSAQAGTDVRAIGRSKIERKNDKAIITKSNRKKREENNTTS